MFPPLSPHRRRARAEAFIRDHRLPPSVLAKVAAAHPELRRQDLKAIEAGLREWLICCLHRGDSQLGMPSRAVDWAWHEFILHTPAYHAFCREAYGTYLHHVPEADLGVPMHVGLRETVRAWDRSEAGRAGSEPSLWDLDERLGIADPGGVPDAERRAARRPSPFRDAGRPHAAPWYYAAGGDGGGGSGCGGGGGCGGGA